MIPYGRQDIDENDVAAVVAVLGSDFLTQGPAVGAFEAAIAARVGARHAIACNSATSGLHAAYAALGVGPGDRVWTSPITFVATANAARMLGADVGFVDIDPQTLNMDVEDLRRRLETAKADGSLPKVVAPVHFTGRPCDMADIAALAKEYGFRIVEDAAHAIGATEPDGTPTGACRYSDIAVFSFHPVKIITSGEGGMNVTNDDDLADRMRMFVSHGITRDPARMRADSEGGWYYEQLSLGFNYRMTDIHAALGQSQLGRIDGFLAARRAHVRAYDAALKDLPLIRPALDRIDGSAWHLYAVQVDPAVASRRDVFDKLRAAGIWVQVHYIPVHLQPYYRDLGFAPGDFPHAEAYYANAVSLPLFAKLTDDERGYVVETLSGILA